MLTMKGLVIFLIHLMVAVKLITVPDLQQVIVGLYYHMLIISANLLYIAIHISLMTVVEFNGESVEIQ